MHALMMRAPTGYPPKWSASLVLTAILLAGALLPGIGLQAASADGDSTQRAAYGAALAHLHAGRTAEFARLRAQLADYVLRPYLDYHDLLRRLDVVSEADLLTFRQQHGDLPVTRNLYHRWLKRQAERGQWQALARNPPETSDPELQCLYLRARLAAGETSGALAAATPLWTVGRSQPNACDPLFEAWTAAGYLTQDLAWTRLQLAIADNQTGLARYLLRFFDGEARTWAQALYDVHVQPEAVLDRERFRADPEQSRAVLTQGLRRLAGASTEPAEAAWADYRQSHKFTAEQASAITEALLLAHARQGRFTGHWPAALPLPAPDALLQAVAQAAVNQQQWSAARRWIETMPPQLQSETRWQYWTARALGEEGAQPTANQAIYRTLSGQRDYYGFLAAQRIGAPSRLNAAPRLFDPEVERQLLAMAPVRRAMELYAVGDMLNARREWHHLLPALTEAQQVHAAYLAQQSGWIPQSIQIANAAMLRDHVDLRFPVAYPELFTQVSASTTVAKPFLLAIARQESLFDAAARSSADARGLMQLLPSTATHVARISALAPPGTQQLHEPAINVELGGRHLARLLQRYGDRRPLAAAAYNAGEGRVDRWIRDRSGEPIDIWIETIPFGETRNYVKNVLAFTQVYGQLLDTPSPMLEVHETLVP